MKALILAAGYGTRLRPFTDNTAKPLLPIAGKPILEYLLERILPLRAVDGVYIVCNGKFFQAFLEWKTSFETRRKSKRLPIHLLNDGTTSNETRLGAIRDIALAIDTFCIDDDLMVSAADDLFTFDFQSLVDAFYEKGKSIITLHPSNDPHVLRNSGNARIDARGRVFRFVEKPSHPKSNLVAPCLYILSRSTLPFISRYLNAHNDPDAPGHFLSWLVRKMTVWNFLFEESFYPLGDISSYERTQRIFKKRNA